MWSICLSSDKFKFSIHMMEDMVLRRAFMQRNIASNGKFKSTSFTVMIPANNSISFNVNLPCLCSFNSYSQHISRPLYPPIPIFITLDLVRTVGSMSTKKFIKIPASALCRRQIHRFRSSISAGKRISLTDNWMRDRDSCSRDRNDNLDTE